MEWKAGASLTLPWCQGGCFVGFTNIVGVGYRNLVDGQEVLFTFEAPGFKQDGYDFRALQVRPGVEP